MNTTPLWVPLVVAALGFVGTALGAIGGVLITQRRADKREAASWAREQEREQARWAREDKARTFEHRRESYVAFYESLRKMAIHAYNHGYGLTDDDSEQLLEGWQTETFERLQHLDLYASREVSDLARSAYNAIWNWGHATIRGRLDASFLDGDELTDIAINKLVKAVRTDLRVPENLTLGDTPSPSE
jgi:hypothetical protein